MMAKVKDALSLNLKGKEREDLGQKLITQIRDARQGMKPALDKLKVWDRFYEGNLKEKTFPWKDCSNLNIPLTQANVDTYHAAVCDTILGVDRLMNVLPPSFVNDEELKKKAMTLESIIDAVYTEEMDIRASVDEWLLLSLKEQAAIVKLPWREEYKTIKRRVFDPATGKESAQEEVINKYRGPKVELVDLRNFVIYPLTAKTIDEAVLVGDRFALTEDDLRRKVASGLYDSEVVDEVLKGKGEAENSTSEDLEETEKNDVDGIDPTSFERYWFWEVIAGYDANNDGLKEDCVFTIESATGRIVRAAVFPYYHGHRWYIPMRLFPRPRRFLGRCIPQILEGTQRELNALHNQRIDATTQALTKAFKVLKSREGNGDDIVLAPGQTIWVDTPDEVTEFAISPAIPGSEYEEITNNWAERALAVNDVANGRGTEQKKTLGEINLVSQKSGQRFSLTISRAHEPLVEMTRQVVGLLYQFLTDEELQILGQGKITRDDLLLPWRYMPRGTLGAADKQAQQQTAMIMYQTLMQNPLVANDPMHVYKLTQDVLTAFDKQDVDSYIGAEEELQMRVEQAKQIQAQQAQQMAQEQAMMGGQIAEGGVGAMGVDPGAMGGAGGPDPQQIGGGMQGPSFG